MVADSFAKTFADFFAKIFADIFTHFLHIILQIFARLPQRLKLTFFEKIIPFDLTAGPKKKSWKKTREIK